MIYRTILAERTPYFALFVYGSIDISVSASWESRNTTSNADGTFGSLERHINGNILYAVEPTWSIGYSF